MWNDNETEIDLLGFEYLVDSLEILLTEDALLPLTVGVLGDWGSGKSSLMRLAKSRLDDATAAVIPLVEERRRAGEEITDGDPRPFITIAFSPWRFENFVQVKLALMDAVLDEIDDYIDGFAEDSPPKKKMSAARRYFRPLRGRMRAAIVPAVGIGSTAGAVSLGLPPELGPVVGASANALVPPAPPAPPEDDPAADKDEDEPDLFESVGRFHIAFEELLESISEVQAVVVFIDDMDRCEERAIIDTFETIRLFLHAPKTAFVLGMNEPVIAAALQDRYPERTPSGSSRAKQYVEKMIQASVAVPPLSEAEVLSYISLLFASKHVDDDQMDLLRTRADEERAKNPNAVTMNLGIAREVLSEGLTADLESDLGIAAQVGGPLATGLRGNPRQVKRFLNRLQLRLRVADKRSMDLDPLVLSKLMVLEETSEKGFEQLFVWQNDNDGHPPQIEIGEALANQRPTPEGTRDLDGDVTEWTLGPKVEDWLRIEPSLVGVALGPYFTFSRDRLKTSVRASRLSPEQQQLLTRLQAPTEAARKLAVAETLTDPRQASAVAGVLLDHFPSSVTSKGSRSLIQIAAAIEAVAADLFVALADVPPGTLNRALALHLAAHLGEDDRMIKQVETWRDSGRLSAQATEGFSTHMPAEPAGE